MRETPHLPVVWSSWSLQNTEILPQIREALGSGRGKVSPLRQDNADGWGPDADPQGLQRGSAGQQALDGGGYVPCFGGRKDVALGWSTGRERWGAGHSQVLLVKHIIISKVPSFDVAPNRKPMWPARRTASLAGCFHAPGCSSEIRVYLIPDVHCVCL